MIKKQLYYFEGLDESIIKLNDYIIDDGFEFVKYNLSEFEERFEELLPLNENYYDEVESCNMELFNKLPRLIYFDAWRILNNGYVIFLSDNIILANLDAEFLTDKKELADSENKRMQESFKRVKELLKKFKLFKSGHIKLLSSFTFFDIGLFPFSFSSPSRRINGKYFLENSDSTELKYFKSDLLIPEYLTLAFNSFLEYYNVEDKKIKFIMLMISLETIFNVGSQLPIKHIISRHAALTITRDKKVFEEKSERIRILYNLRSSLVHGRDEQEKTNKKYNEDLKNLSIYILELEEIIRDVLKQLIWDNKIFGITKPKSKQDLFNILNTTSTITDLSSN